MDTNGLLAILYAAGSIATVGDALSKLIQFFDKNRKCRRFKKEIVSEIKEINAAREKLFGGHSKEIGSLINKILAVLPADGAETAPIVSPEEIARLDEFYDDLIISTLRKMRDLKQDIYEYGKLCVTKKGEFKKMLYKVDDSCKDALSLTHSKMDSIGLPIMKQLGIEEQNAGKLLEIIKTSGSEGLMKNPYVEKVFSALEEIRAVGKNPQGAYDF